VTFNRNNTVGLLLTPTNASHLNRIEFHFWAYVSSSSSTAATTPRKTYSKARRAYIGDRNRDRYDLRVTALVDHLFQQGSEQPSASP